MSLAVRAAALLAAPEPTPSPSETPAYKPADVTSLNSWWEWFKGIPLHVILICVVSTFILVLLRIVIRTITDHIAEGTPITERAARPLADTSVGSALLKADPLASARRSQRSRTLGSVLRSTAGVIVGSIALLLVLDQLGVNLAPFIASAGIIGVAFGFGAQSLVKDFLTGTFMLLEDQYGVGDVVDVGPASGTVEAVTLRVTKVRDNDGTLWYVPNGSMLRVGNKTQGWSTAVVEVDVDYFADLDQVRELLMAAVRKVEADPELGPKLQGEPTITGIERLAADAVTLRVRVRTSPATQWDVARALRTAARAELERAGIPLAGQRDLLAAHRADLAARAPAADDEPTSSTTPDPHDTFVDEARDNRDARRAAPDDEPGSIPDPEHETTADDEP
ncbi:mechanosensitive ion channel family protein [Cellulomonas alba]|uniref:Mechanosensitive ion channel n=1 Tax=Cellulomonas alba TaxID=3053467 RepID=A0ABT7SIE4_9CELL|nr:mechanosensitive ion channel domain-containing protein [Cellulomonas alba]MDM7855957.1 mechanosensitive ion channel [Cellulomonas alba]